MRNEIFNNRNNESWSWVIATRGIKYITLKYVTAVQGCRDVTITYDKKDEAELLETLNDPRFQIDMILELEWGPKPIKTVIHEATR